MLQLLWGWGQGCFVMRSKQKLYPQNKISQFTQHQQDIVPDFSNVGGRWGVNCFVTIVTVGDGHPTSVPPSNHMHKVVIFPKTNPIYRPFLIKKFAKLQNMYIFCLQAVIFDWKCYWPILIRADASVILSHQKVYNLSRQMHWEEWWTMSHHPPQSSIHLVFSCFEWRRVVLSHT